MMIHYLRDSDLAEYKERAPLMGDIQYTSNKFWIFNIHGKGNKKRRIALNNEVLNALADYREYHSMAPKPLPGEATPLLLSKNGNSVVNLTRQIRGIIGRIFNLAKSEAERLKFDEHVISKFENAQAHWLRHSGISYDLNTKRRPIGHVKDDAGHSSLATTSLYLQSDEEDRFRSVNEIQPPKTLYLAS